jgi:hypothetical protein
VVKVLVLLNITAALLAAEQATTGWQIETVDSLGVGQSSSMKFDSEGNAHVCYVLGRGQQLKYAFWDHKPKRWYTMVVDDGPNSCSLALDAQQRPHISYADYGTGDGARLRYAHWTGTSWVTQVVPVSSFVVAGYISIAIDASNQPNIAYYEYRGPRGTDFKIRLRTAMWNGKYWEVRTVDGEEGSGKINNMISDAHGNLHIAYANVAIGEMRYAYWNGKVWMLETVEGRQQGQQSVGFACAITSDKEGNLHVTYQNVSQAQLKYAVRTNGRWKTYTLDRLTGFTEDLDRYAITVDDAGDVYITYYDAGVGVLKLAHKRSEKWSIEVIDTDGAGFTSSVQVDRGLIWVTYADERASALKVARRTVQPSVQNTVQHGPSDASAETGNK